MFVPAQPRQRDHRPLWDQPVWPSVRGGVVTAAGVTAAMLPGTVDVVGGITAAAVAGIAVDPGCQGRPTVLLATFGWTAADFDTYPDASCYPWDEDAPLWAGEARGLFRFNAHAVPSRTHGGLASQAAVETRLGRSIPDPTDPEGEVYYWDSYPRVFHIRNNSGVTVEARFTRTGGCADFTHQVLDTEELAIGPFYGDASHVLVQIVGPTTATGGAPTVPTGVDVKVTAPVISDPGETFDFGCTAPSVPLFDETFTGAGYGETWDLGETVTGAAVLDEDASPPGGAPSFWDSEALHVSAALGETAFVRHSDLGVSNPASWATIGVHLVSHSFAPGDGAFVLTLREAGGADILQAYFANSGGQLQFTADVRHDGASNTHSINITTGSFHTLELQWDQAAEQWALYFDGTLAASGAITGTPASADYEIRELVVGVSSAAEEAVDYYVGRFTVSTGRAGYL